MKKIIISIILAAMAITPLLAQSSQITFYERDRYELANTAVKKITEPLTSEQQILIALVYTKMKKNAEDIFDNTIIMENIIFHYCGKDGGLRTQIHELPRYGYPERGRIGNYTKTWNNVWQWYLKKRTELDKTATDDDRKREAERANFKLGKGDLVHSISDAYVQWAMHAPGEKESDYTSRIANNAVAAFDSIAFLVCDSKWKAGLMSITKEEYDNDKHLQHFSLNYRIGERPWSIPGQCKVGYGEMKYARMSTVDDDECYAEGIHFMEGILVPTSFWLHLNGSTKEYLIHVSDADELNIKADEVKIEGTESFRSIVEAAIKDHVFNYGEYTKARVRRNELFKNINRIWSVYAGLSNAGMDVRLDEFIPSDATFSKSSAKMITESFQSYCADNLTRWMYGEYYGKCSSPVHLSSIVRNMDISDIGAINNAKTAVNAAIDRYLKGEALKNLEVPVDALCLIHGLAENPGLINAENKAYVFISSSKALESGYSLFRKTLRKNRQYSRTPALDYLNTLYKEF